MRRGLVIGLASGLIGAATIAAVAQGLMEEDPQGAAPAEIAELAILGEPVTRDMIEQGGAIYAESCAACHGAQLKGQPDWRRRTEDGRMPAPPHDDSGHTWHHADKLLFEMTKYGLQAIAGGDYKTRMPAYEGTLSDDDIVAVLSYIKSQWPDKVIQIHNEQINQ